MGDTLTTRKLYLPRIDHLDPYAKTALVERMLSELSTGDLQQAAEWTAALRHLLREETTETQDGRTIVVEVFRDAGGENKVILYLRRALTELLVDKENGDIDYSEERGVPYARATMMDSEAPTPGYDMLSAVFHSGVLIGHAEGPDEVLLRDLKEALDTAYSERAPWTVRALKKIIERLEAG